MNHLKVLNFLDNVIYSTIPSDLRKNGLKGRVKMASFLWPYFVSMLHLSYCIVIGCFQKCPLHTIFRWSVMRFSKKKFCIIYAHCAHFSVLHVALLLGWHVWEFVCIESSVKFPPLCNKYGKVLRTQYIT